MITFIENCLIQRILSSPMDALFCAEFVRCLVRWKTPRYDHLFFSQNIVKICLTLLRGATTAETLNVSVFVLELIRDMKRWAESERIFKECAANPVFQMEGKDVFCYQDMHQVKERDLSWNG